MLFHYDKIKDVDNQIVKEDIAYSVMGHKIVTAFVVNVKKAIVIKTKILLRQRKVWRWKDHLVSKNPNNYRTTASGYDEKAKIMKAPIETLDTIIFVKSTKKSVFNRKR